MPYFMVDGIKYYIPGAKGKIEVVTDSPGALPDFNIGLMMGEIDEGIPYYWNDSLKKEEEEDQDRFFEVGSTKRVQELFGTDCKLAKAMAESKKHGLTRCYSCGVNALERASIILQDGSANDVITLHAKKAGFPSNYIKIEVEASSDDRNVKFTPVKLYVKLAADAAISDKRIYVKEGGERLSKGMQLVIIDKTSGSQESITISDVTYKIASTAEAGVTGATFLQGQKIYAVDLESALTKAFEVSDSACLIQSVDDSDIEETGNYDKAEINAIAAHINANSQYFFAEVNSTAYDLAALADDYLKEQSNATAGTTTALAASDWTSLFTNLNDYLNTFSENTGLLMRLFLMVDYRNAEHIKLRNWLNTRRTAGLPGQAIAGINFGVVYSGGDADTNPKTAAANLNSQDFRLCGEGYDHEGAWLSLAPAYFGICIGNSIKHNATRDRVYCTKKEKVWDEDNSGEMTGLIRAGVIFMHSNKGGKYIVDEINTLQVNDLPWNASTNETCYPTQRDLADFAHYTMIVNVDQDQTGQDGSGNSETDENAVRGYCFGVAKKLLNNGFINSYTIDDIAINENGNGYDVEWSYTVPKQKNFFNITSRILV